MKIIRSNKADDVSIIDLVLRIGAALLLGAYSTSMMDIVFLVVNFGSAALSIAVLSAALWVKHSKGGQKTGNKLVGAAS